MFFRNFEVSRWKILSKSFTTVYLVLDSSKETQIDDILCETNEKLGAIAVEMRAIKFSDLDNDSMKSKLEVLRQEFQKILDEQQRRVSRIMNND